MAVPVPNLTQRMINNADPFNVRARLYNQVSELLSQLESGSEDITTRERIAALAAIGRLEVIFTALRAKDDAHDPSRGSAVRKYAAAFKTDGHRRRAASSGTSGLAEAAAAAAESDDLDIGI